MWLDGSPKQPSKNIDSEVVNIAKLSKEAIKVEDRHTLLGFCSPTHGFNFPPITLKFLLRFPKGKNRVFIMNTRAGMKLGKFYLCGLSGLAQLLAAFILVMKGYKIVGMRPVDLPSNWISVHPGLKKRVAASMFIRCERNTKRFADHILAGRRRYRALYDVIQDLALTPIAVLYYFIGRFVLAKSLVASHACTMYECMSRKGHPGSSWFGDWQPLPDFNSWYGTDLFFNQGQAAPGGSSSNIR